MMRRFYFYQTGRCLFVSVPATRAAELNSFVAELELVLMASDGKVRGVEALEHETLLVEIKCKDLCAEVAPLKAENQLASELKAEVLALRKIVPEMGEDRRMV